MRPSLFSSGVFVAFLQRAIGRSTPPPRFQRMNFPAAPAGLAGGALQPVFRPAVDIACQKIPASASLRGIGLGQRRPRAPVSGFSHGWLESLSPLVSTSEAALRAKARSPSVGAGPPAARPIAPVESRSPILAKAASVRDRLQPPEPTPTRISVITAPAGPIADRPTRPHVLYRASPDLGCNALWAAGERNSDS